MANTTCAFGSHNRETGPETGGQESKQIFFLSHHVQPSHALLTSHPGPTDVQNSVQHPGSP
jgi:hypothetical protein